MLRALVGVEKVLQYKVALLIFAYKNRRQDKRVAHTFWSNSLFFPLMLVKKLDFGEQLYWLFSFFILF
jgi:hypothetical protein